MKAGMFTSFASLLLCLVRGEADNANETMGVRRLRGFHHAARLNEMNFQFLSDARMEFDSEFFAFDNWNQVLDTSEKRDYLSAYRAEYDFFQHLIDQATRHPGDREFDAMQGYGNFEDEDEFMLDTAGGVEVGGSSGVPKEVGEAIFAEVMALKKELKKLEGELTAQIVAACAASALANGADPFPIPAISAAADIGITLTLSQTMGSKFESGIKHFDLAKRIASRAKSPIIKTFLLKTAKGQAIDAMIKKIVSKAKSAIVKRVMEMATVKWIKSFFAKKSGQVAATSQLKWVPILGQIAAGSISSVFMKYSAEDIRRLYSNLYFDKLREAIYESFGQPVPEVRLSLSKTGFPGFRVWTMIAYNTVTNKVIVKIDKNYGATGNEKKAKDFFKAVEEKGFFLTSEQCAEIASKMSIWDSDWYKDFKPGA